MTTPLPPTDTVQVAEFWGRFLAAGTAPADTPVPEVIEPFGDSAEQADELLALVIHGPKRATAASYEECVQDGVAPGQPGDLSIATDGAGRARAVLRTTEVRIGPLSSVDDAFAWDEGEGDRTRAMWLADHHEFFSRYLPTVGIAFGPDMPTIFERFDVVYAE